MSVSPVSIYRYEISIVDISTLLKTIDIDKDKIDIDKAFLENIAIAINKDNLENIDIVSIRTFDINNDFDRDILDTQIIFFSRLKTFSRLFG